MDINLQMIELNKDICTTQARIYEQAAYDGCDIKVFSDKYLESNFCQNRIETLYSPFQREDARTCLEFIYPEIQIPQDNNSKKIFDPDIAYWMGYTYHQIYCETDIPGRNLKNLIPFELLLVNYEAHHTLDEFESVHKICDYYKLCINSQYLKYEAYLDNLQI